MLSLRPVTPDDARSWLPGSRQKTIQLHRVREVLSAMEGDGTWDPELHKTQPVHVARGRLRSGHHRLFALLLYGSALDMWVKEE